mmetsp:Transcript_64161/g.165160  ORF Transcript_64161/g.165160 Transcript_64161/m.165160 type:complete len:246 (-) Transcript_64161:7-744(-)
MRHLLEHRRHGIVTARRDEAVLLQAFPRPLLGAGHRPQRADDVGVVLRVVRGGDRGHEDLVAPEHRQALAPRGGVGTRLSDDALQDAGRPGRWQLHARLVVVLRARQRSQARALARRVKEGDRSSVGQLLDEVAPVELHMQLAGLPPGVEGAQEVAGAARPVLVYSEHCRRRGHDHALLALQATLPVRRLLCVRGTDDGDVVASLSLHERHILKLHLEGRHCARWSNVAIPASRRPLSEQWRRWA